MPEALVIDHEHPWPWLGAYTRDAEDLFNGREGDIQGLMRCVLAAPATVLFGRSGLGKTSLLQAGLGPALLRRRLLPVFVRRLHDIDGDLSTAVLADLQAAAAAQNLVWSGEPPACGDAPQAVVGLWELLHDRARCLMDAQRERWAPVLVLDPFEEIFTQTAWTARRDRAMAELGDLIEGRVPAGVHERLGRHEELLDRIDPGLQGCRVLLSLREDYLPDLEAWADAIPRLGPNRYRLMPMDREQALRAVDVTGGALVTSEVSASIVDFLIRQESRTGRRRNETGTVEPALLSLICASLNEERLAQGGRQLDARQLESRGGRILERFYDDAFEGLAPAAARQARRWVQRELITGDGTRRPFPVDALKAQGIDDATLHRLIDRRLLRIESGEQGDAVELVHDRLAAVAADRDRDDRQREAETERRAAEDRQLERRAERTRYLTGAGALLLLAGVVGFALVYDAYRDAESARAELDVQNGTLNRTLIQLDGEKRRAVAAEQGAKQAEDEARVQAGQAQRAASQAETEARRANEAEVHARRVAAEATTLRLLAEGSEIANGQREGGAERGILMVLAGYRMAMGQSSYARASAVGTLMRQAVALDRLDWVRDGNMPMQPDGTAFESRMLLGLAASPDNRWLATGDERGVLRLWTSDGRPVARVEAHKEMLIGLAFSPDGSRLVSAGLGGPPRQWRVPDLRPIEPALAVPVRANAAAKDDDDDGPTVPAVVFSHDGRRILAGGSRNRLYQWDAVTGQLLKQTRTAGRDLIFAMALEPDGRRLATQSAEGQVQVWDADTGAPIGEAAKIRSSGEVVGLAWSRDGRRLYVVDGDASVTMRDATTLAVIATLQGHSDAVHSVVISPDGRLVATTAADGDIRLWDAQSGAPYGEPLRGQRRQSAFLAFDRDGTRLWSTSLDGTLRQWAVRPAGTLARPLLQSKPEESGIDRLVFAGDGRRLLADRGSGRYVLWTRDAASAWPATTGQVDSPSQFGGLGFGPADGLWLLDNRGDVFDWMPGRKAQVRPAGDRQPIVALTRDGLRAVALAGAGRVRRVDAVTRAPLGPSVAVGEPVRGSQLALTTDGRLLAIARREPPELSLWDLETGQRRASVPLPAAHYPTALALAPRGDAVAVGFSESAVLLWRPDARSSAPVLLRQHHEEVGALSFDPSGRWLFTGGEDKTWRLWDASTGMPVGPPMRGHSAEIRELAVSPDGQLLASGDADGGVTVWPVLGAWVDLLCAKVATRLDVRRWKEWLPADLPFAGDGCPAAPRLPSLPRTSAPQAPAANALKR